MNHGVAVRTNDGEVSELCLAGFGSVGERFEMVNLCVVPAKLAINSFKIKTAFCHIAFQFAATKLPGFSNFGVAK
jgi:hypothetical protein